VLHIRFDLSAQENSHLTPIIIFVDNVYIHTRVLAVWLFPAV